MWWLVGFCAIAILIFLFSIVWASFLQARLVQDAVHLVSQSFRLLNGPDRFFDESIDDRVWRDPYLLGYVQGSLSILMAALGSRLTTVKKGWVVIKVLQQLVGKRWKDVNDRIVMLSGQHDAEFSRGLEHGADVSALIANRARPRLLAEPEVQEALRVAPDWIRAAEGVADSAQMSETAAAGAVLMKHYMERHRQEAGY
jgi:hypothetical protein